MLPQSNNQTTAKAITTISITKDIRYYINDDNNVRSVSFNEIEPFLVQHFGNNNDDIYIALHADETVPIKQVVRVMNLARKNNYKMILATAPE